MWQVKGEEYLKKLAAQDLYLGRDQRLLAESLAKGRVAVMIGNTYYSYAPFRQSGVADQSRFLHSKRERYGTGGSGNLAIIKAPAHPNGTKVFVNWLLGREGQEVVSESARSSDPPPRCRYSLAARIRHDRRPKMLCRSDDFLQIENQSEEKLEKVREPAAKFAQALLK